MRRRLRRLVIVAAAEGRDAGKAVADIEGIGDLAHFAVANDVDAGGGLFCHDLANRLGKTRLESRLIELPAVFPRFEKGQEIRRARQAAYMGRENAVRA